VSGARASSSGCARAQHSPRPVTGPIDVENGLLNSLFGLLCWQAIFAPVAGAFFHEFQAAPADLLAPDFHTRREAHFARCFAQLDSDAYRDTICRNFQQKQGIQSPFVFWGVVSEALLGLALSCLPPHHLKACFARILSDIRANRCGLPDLVQFWPQERRYQLIEVKGPGDRLQDNRSGGCHFACRRASGECVSCVVDGRSAIAPGAIARGDIGRGAASVGGAHLKYEVAVSHLVRIHGEARQPRHALHPIAFGHRGNGRPSHYCVAPWQLIPDGTDIGGRLRIAARSWPRGWL